MEKKEKEKEKRLEYSKKLINDVRWLLWVITIGGIVLAFGCVYKDFSGGLPWITAMVGLPWTAHGVICAAYMNKSKAENTEGGIVYKNMMNEFEEVKCEEENWQSPQI